MNFELLLLTWCHFEVQLHFFFFFNVWEISWMTFGKVIQKDFHEDLRDILIGSILRYTTV